MTLKDICVGKPLGHFVSGGRNKSWKLGRCSVKPILSWLSLTHPHFCVCVSDVYVSLSKLGTSKDSKFSITRARGCVIKIGGEHFALCLNVTCFSQSKYSLHQKLVTLLFLRQRPQTKCATTSGRFESASSPMRGTCLLGQLGVDIKKVYQCPVSCASSSIRLHKHPASEKDAGDATRDGIVTAFNCGGCWLRVRSFR